MIRLLGALGFVMVAVMIGQSGLQLRSIRNSRVRLLRNRTGIDSRSPYLLHCSRPRPVARLPMSFGEPRRSKIPFAEVQASKAFMTEAQLLLVREMVRRSGEFVSEGSNQTFYHGRDWTYLRAGRDGYTTQVGHLKLHQQEVIVSQDRLLANDMTVLPELIPKTAQEKVALIKGLGASLSSRATESEDLLAPWLYLSTSVVALLPHADESDIQNTFRSF